MRLELAHGVPDVTADGLGGQEQPLTDLLAGETVGGQAEHLALARGEPAGALGVEEDAGQSRVDVHAAVGHHLERAHEVLERCVLEHEALRARVQDLRHARDVALPRIDDDRGLGREPLGLAGRVRAAHAGEPEVDERDLGPVLGDEGESCLAVPCPPLHGEPTSLEQGADGLEDDRMVVRDDAGEPAAPALAEAVGNLLSTVQTCGHFEPPVAVCMPKGAAAARNLRRFRKNHLEG